MSVAFGVRARFLNFRPGRAEYSTSGAAVQSARLRDGPRPATHSQGRSSPHRNPLRSRFSAGAIGGGGTDARRSSAPGVSRGGMVLAAAWNRGRFVWGRASHRIAPLPLPQAPIDAARAYCFAVLLFDCLPVFRCTIGAAKKRSPGRLERCSWGCGPQPVPGSSMAGVAGGRGCFSIVVAAVPGAGQTLDAEVAGAGRGRVQACGSIRRAVHRIARCHHLTTCGIMQA
jgi:hypothetical protein